jgi:uroporphyrinogen-III synthase
MTAMTALQNKTIAVPESRELDVFAGLLERRGARVWRCPLISIVDARDPAPTLHWMRGVVNDGCDELILLTGEGLRRLISCAERHDPALVTSFIAALARVRIITRGPKPARALKELGLASNLAAAVPTTAGVIDALRSLNLRSHRVGVQLYGTEPNLPLMEYLAGVGAAVFPVAPYEYADAADDQAVHELIAALQAVQIDAIAFTSKAQVVRLFSVAGDAAAKAALSRTLVAAIGPVVAAELQQRGVSVATTPQESWFMKPLATELVALFSGTSAAKIP